MNRRDFLAATATVPLLSSSLGDLEVAKVLGGNAAQLFGF